MSRWKVLMPVHSVLLVVAGMAGPASAALVGQWTFNEGSGATAFDSSGVGTNGVLNGVTYVAGPGSPGTNYAAHFDGVDDFIEYAHTAAYDVAGDFTVEAWINIDATAAGEALVFGQAAARYGLTASSDYVYQYVDNDPFFYKGGTFRGGAFDPATPWRHVVAVWDQASDPDSDRLEIFIDFGAGDYYQFNANDLVVPDYNSGVYLTGKSAFGWLKGDIDEIRYYDHAMTISEIQTSFLAGPTLVPEPASMVFLGAMGLLMRRSRRAA